MQWCSLASLRTVARAHGPDTCWLQFAWAPHYEAAWSELACLKLAGQYDVAGGMQEPLDLSGLCAQMEDRYRQVWRIHTDGREDSSPISGVTDYMYSSLAGLPSTVTGT